MKKSLMITGIIVILGITWITVSWFTGKLIEQHMASLVERANAYIKAEWPGSEITLAVQNYQRGIFSSSARYLLRAEGNKLTQNLLKSGDEIAINETISHGPFPPAQLKRFNFIPQMASVHLILDNTPAVKKWFDITGGQSPVQANSRIAYNGDTSSDITMIPVDFGMDTITLKFSGATLKAQHSTTLHKLSLQGKADSFILAAKNHEDKKEQVTLKDITLNSTKNAGKFGLSMGEDQLGIKQLLLNVDGKDIVTLADFHLKTQLNETDRYINGQLDYTLSALHLHGHHFGSGRLTMNVDRIDGQAVRELTSDWYKALEQGYQDKSSDPDSWFAQWDTLLASRLPTFLQSEPVFTVAPFSWKNTQGESRLTLSLALAPASTDTQDHVQQHQSSFQKVKNMDMALTIPMAMLEEFVTQAARLRGHEEEEARKLAQQQAQGLSALGQLFKLTVTKDEAISSSVRYMDNQAELNGQKISLQELIDLFSPFSLSVQ